MQNGESAAFGSRFVLPAGFIPNSPSAMVFRADNAKGARHPGHAPSVVRSARLQPSVAFFDFAIKAS